MDCIELAVADQPLILSSHKTAYFADRRLLLAADLHLGKEGTFRQAGIAVPLGSTVRTLARLAAAIEEFAPTHCCILGDLVHASNSLTQQIFEQVMAWMARYQGRVEFSLTLGNHDRHSISKIRQLPFSSIQKEQELGEVLLVHDATSFAPKGTFQFAIGGHIHPCFRVPRSSGDTARVSCFWKQADRLVLPAFGDFTGNANIRLNKNDAAYLICEHELIRFRGRSCV